MTKRNVAIVIALLLIVGAVGCAGIDTPEKKALAMRESFNQGLAEYVLLRPDLPVEKVKVVDPLFKAAAATLNLYEDKLRNGIQDQAALEAFIKNKNEITKEIGGLIGWKVQ